MIKVTSNKSCSWLHKEKGIFIMESTLFLHLTYLIIIFILHRVISMIISLSFNIPGYKVLLVEGVLNRDVFR